MRFSLVALVGLAAFGGEFGADARAVPNDLALSSSSIAARHIETVEKPKRAVTDHILPRVPGGGGGPVIPKPETPKPVLPKPVLPKPVTPKVPGPGQGEPTLEEATIQEFTQGSCSALKARSIIKRARTAADTINPDAIHQWLVESGISAEGIVMYAGEDGRKMAEQFVNRNPGTKWFWNIFDMNFWNAFGGIDFKYYSAEGGVKARSIALGRFVRNPLAFNIDRGMFF